MVEVRIGDGARYVAAGENVVQQLVFRQTHAQRLGLWRGLTLPFWQHRAWRQYCLGLAETLRREEGVDHEFTELRALFSPANLPVVIEKVERRLGEILDQYRLRRVIVLGEPGSGKTTSLRHLAMLQARAAASSRRARIPMFVSLGSYTGEDPVEFLQDKVLGSGRWELAVLLPKMLAQGRMILFLDALNEMPGTNYDGNIRLLRGWMESYSQNRFVFSCRTEHYRGELGIRQATVQRLTDAMIRDFAVRYRPEDGLQLFDTLRRDDLLEMVRNPLILWMVLKTGITSSNRGLLIEGFVKTLLVREEAKRDVHREYRRAPSEELSRALEHLAFQSQSRYRSTMLPLAEAKTLLDEGREGSGAAYDFVEQGCDALLLRFTDPRRRNLAFWHQILQEYLTAAYLERHLVRLDDEELRRLASDPWWWETLVLLSGLVEDGPALIDRLVDEESSVEALLLASALAANTRDEYSDLSSGLIARLVEKLEQGLDEATRVAATELASVAGSRFLIELADRAVEGGDACLMEAASLMVQLGDRAAIDWLLDQFEELLDRRVEWSFDLYSLPERERESVRLKALRSHFRSELPRLGGPLAQGLLSRLETRSVLVGEAADLLTSVGEPAVQVLIDYLHSDAPKRLRLRALEWLGDIRGSELAIDGVMDYLADEDSDIHWAAVKALVRLGQAEQEWGVVLKLTDKMGSKNWLERLAVVEVAGGLGSDAAGDFLEAATRDRHPEVRAAASTHLRARESGSQGLLFSTGTNPGDLQAGIGLGFDFRTLLSGSTEDIAHDEAEPLETMGLWDHIEELRLRLVSSVSSFLVALGLGLGVFVMRSERVTEWVTGGAHHGPMRLWSVGLPLACTLAAGIAVLWSLRQALHFILPALYLKERKVARRLYVALMILLPSTTFAYGALSYWAISWLGIEEPLLVVFERLPVVLLLLTLATGLLLLVRVVARRLPLLYDQVLFFSALMLGPLVSVLGPNRIRALKLRVRHQRLLELSGSNIKPMGMLLLMVVLGVALPLYSILPFLALTALWLLTAARASELPAIFRELGELGKPLRSLGPTLDREIQAEWIHDTIRSATTAATAESGDTEETLPTMSLLNHFREARQRLIQATLLPPAVASGLWGLGKLELLRLGELSFWDLYLWIAWPTLMFQAWRFVAPGLYRNERRFAGTVFLLIGSLPVLMVGLGALLRPWWVGSAVELPNDAHLRVALLAWLSLAAFFLFYLSFFSVFRRFFRIGASGLVWVGGAAAVLWPVRLVPWMIVVTVALMAIILALLLRRKERGFF